MTRPGCRGAETAGIRSTCAVAIRCFVAAAAALVSPSEARAFECLRFGCPSWCGPVEYSLASRSAELEALAPGTSEALLQQAMSDWTRVPGVDLDVAYRGLTPDTADSAAEADGRTVVQWYDTGWPYDSNAIGITDVQLNGRCIVEADVELNGENYVWTTGPGGAGRVNAYTILLHEGGHVIGLGHSDAAFAVMYFLYRGGQLTLSGDDFEGALSLYPGGTEDCTEQGCPLGFECVEGACEASMPPECISSDECPPGERCDAVSGACVPDAPGEEALGAPCVDDSDCESGLCALLASGGVCSQPCDGLAARATACPTGFFCDGDAVGVCGTGLCLDGVPGDGSLGAPCEEDSDCTSNMCDGAVCATPCDPAVLDGCPFGFVCEPGDGAGCGACKPPLPLGSGCRFNEDCREGLCFVEDGEEAGVCTQSCSDTGTDTGTGACPERFECRGIPDTYGVFLCLEEVISPPSGSCAVASRWRGGDRKGRRSHVFLLGLCAVCLVTRVGRRRLAH